MSELEAAYINKPLFAIRKKGTSIFIPDVRGNTRTWVEPISITEGIPRFFTKASIAKGFLTVWCKGPLKKTFTQDWETGYQECELEHRPEDAKEPRNAEDYEVVEIFWGVKG